MASIVAHKQPTLDRPGLQLVRAPVTVWTPTQAFDLITSMHGCTTWPTGSPYSRYRQLADHHDRLIADPDLTSLGLGTIALTV